MNGVRIMPDREKVIRGLEAHANPKLCETCAGEECPYYNMGGGYTGVTCSSILAVDALALLKEQEARVMTWDELMGCADGDPAFFEERDQSGCWELVYPTYMCMHDKNGYGERWRYWTYRPTPEQMRDTKWEK